MTPNLRVNGWANDKFELCTVEALIVKDNNPVVNAQVIDFNSTLKILC